MCNRKSTEIHPRIIYVALPNRAALASLPKCLFMSAIHWLKEYTLGGFYVLPQKGIGTKVNKTKVCCQNLAQTIPPKILIITTHFASKYSDEGEPTCPAINSYSCKNNLKTRGLYK